jgi:hypothetical protein
MGMQAFTPPGTVAPNIMQNSSPPEPPAGRGYAGDYRQATMRR